MFSTFKPILADVGGRGRGAGESDGDFDERLVERSTERLRRRRRLREQRPQRRPESAARLPKDGGVVRVVRGGPGLGEVGVWPRGHAVDGRLERDADHGVRSELIDHVVEEADS